MNPKSPLFAGMLALLMLIFACEMPKRPEFRQIKNLKVKSLTKSDVTVTAFAEFYNPNDFGIQLTGIDLDVDIAGEKAGKVSNDQHVEIPAKQAFEVPITFSFDPRELSGGALGSAMNILLEKKMKVHFEGTVTVKVMEVDLDIPVEDEREIPLGKIF